jgi:hypothetical protein
MAVSIERLKREANAVLSSIERGARASDLESSLQETEDSPERGPTVRDEPRRAIPERAIVLTPLMTAR